MKLKFEQVIKKNKNPKCPECFGGHLLYDKQSKLWICCREAGGFMWCGRIFKGKKLLNTK